MRGDRYTLNDLVDAFRWEPLGGGWLLSKPAGLLYHSHPAANDSCESSFYYAASPEYKCRFCGESPPAGIKFHAKFIQLNNI